jgi:ribonucleoside-diphosphate reductase alpha chain
MERIAEEGHIHFDEVPEEVQRSSARRTTSRRSGTCACRPPSRSTWTRPSRRPRTSRTRRPRPTCARSTSSPSLGCKGVTVYRDGSRPRAGPLHRQDREGRADRPAPPARQGARARAGRRPRGGAQPARRGRALKGELARRTRPRRARRNKRQRPAGAPRLHGEDELAAGRPLRHHQRGRERAGPSRSSARSARRAAPPWPTPRPSGGSSLALRSGIPIRQVKDQLRGISCDRAVGLGPNKVLSAPDAIGVQAIERYLEEKAGVQEATATSAVTRSAAISRSSTGNEAARTRRARCFSA